MTKLSISFTAVLLTMTLAPAANAYGTDPAPDTLSEISQFSLVAAQEVQADGTCTVNVTPVLADILGLPDDWRTGDDPALSAIACNGEQ